MKNKRFFLRCLSFAVVLFSACFAACSDDETESPVTLYYKQVGDIGPGMPFRGEAPTFRGAEPTEFAIEAITLDGEAFVDDRPVFMLLPDGSLLIEESDELPLGTYRFTISCLAAGHRMTFADILTVRMVPATPENITVTPSLLEVLYDADRITWPTAQIEAADEAVSFNAYALVQESGKNYFSVSADGVISVNMKFEGEIPPGIYTPTLRLSTKAGTADYEQAVTIKVNSKPLGITYERNPGTAEVAAAFESDVPVLKGSTDEVDYSILSVVPSTDQFAIDPATGVISLPQGHTLEVGTTYDISLAVSNKFSDGEAVVMRGAYSVEVVPYITPVDGATFSYPASTMTEACKFEVEKSAGFVGDVVTFAFGELPEALDGQLTIDKQTGKIAAARGNEIPVGEYSVPVTVSNVKGSAETVLKLTVVANPNMFHKFGYGNNLGLDAESNADQFRYDYETGDPVKNISIAYNDFPEGRPVSFKIESLHAWSYRTLTIDDAGNISIPLRTDRNSQVGYFRVTATVGEGETAVSRSTIVFVTMLAQKSEIVYTPFVHRMNPRRGGYSPVIPETSLDKSTLVLSLRNNYYYIDLNSESKAIKIDAGAKDQTDAWRASWGYRIWATFFTPSVCNAASRLPFSYYGSTQAEFVNSKLAQTLGYIDPTNNFQLYISPNKWMLDGEYANGVFTFWAAYSTDGNVEKMHGSSTKIGVAVWFDEKF